MENSTEVLQKTERELPYDPTVPLLGIYLDKTIIQIDTHTPMFTAALFTTVKTWKQRVYSLTDERVKMTRCIYTTEHYSDMKKNGIMPCAGT